MNDFTRLIQHALEQYKKELSIDTNHLSLLSITKIGNGENNHIFKASIGSNVFVFRIPHRPELIPKLKSEFQMLQTIPKDIGPIPFIFHENAGESYMIQSFIEGKSPLVWNEKLIHAHVEQMARLHNFNHVAVNGVDIVKLFEAKINFRRENDPEVLQDLRISQLIDSLISQIQTLAVSFMDLKSLAFIHGDLHSGNILVSDHAIKYVDWEEAGIGDPALDLAGLLASPTEQVDIDTYLAYYQARTQSDRSLKTRVLTWSLYKDLSLLLHKKWESLDSESRAIQTTDRTYEIILAEIINRMEAKITQLA